MVYVRAFEVAEHIAGVGRECFDIASLAFGKDCVESQRGFPGAAQARYYGELVVRYVDIDIFQIVHTRTDNTNAVGAVDSVVNHAVYLSVQLGLNVFVPAVLRESDSGRGMRTLYVFPSLLVSVLALIQGFSSRSME